LPAICYEHQIVLVVLAATSGLMAVLMLGLHGGPVITKTVSLYAFFGYCLLVIAAMLASACWCSCSDLTPDDVPEQLIGGGEEPANGRGPDGAWRQRVSDGWHHHWPDGRQDGSGHRWLPAGSARPPPSAWQRPVPPVDSPSVLLSIFN